MVRWVRHTAGVALAAALLCGVARPAAAQDAVTEDARLADVQDRLDAAFAAADREGLPSELLEDKVREGLAKHVPAPRIAAVVETVLGHMRTAKGLLRRIPRSASVSRGRLIRATTEALMAGADDAALGRLVAAVVQGEGPKAAGAVEEAMVVVAELAERGVDGRLAGSSVRTAYLGQGRRGWAALLRSVRELGPAASAAERSRAVERAAEAPSRGAPGFEGNPHGGPQGKAKAKGR